MSLIPVYSQHLSPSYQHWKAANRFPQSHLSPKGNKPKSLSLSQGKCSLTMLVASAELTSAHQYHFCTLESKTRCNILHEAYMRLNECWTDGDNPFPQSTSCWMLLPFFAAKAHCWLLFSLLSTRTPPSFSAELSPVSQFPARTVTWGYSFPDAGVCSCSCWISQSSCQPLPPVYWGHSTAALPSSLPTGSPHLAPLANLTRVHRSVAFSRSLIKMLNGRDPPQPSTSHWHPAIIWTTNCCLLILNIQHSCSPSTTWTHAWSSPESAQAFPAAA